MKVKIIFELPEDELEHNLALDGSKLHNALWAFAQYLRQITKYSPEVQINREEVKDSFYEILSDNDINLDNYL